MNHELFPEELYDDHFGIVTYDGGGMGGWTA